jgi:hypothetical protein
MIGRDMNGRPVGRKKTEPPRIINALFRKDLFGVRAALAAGDDVDALAAGADAASMRVT